MARALFGPLGVVLALFPERVLEVYEEVALENPDECTAKSWIVPAIRAEGIVYVVATLAGGRAYAWLMNVAGVAGLAALAFPKQYLDFAASIGYERSDSVTWTDGFTTAVRLLGAAILVLSLRTFARRRRESATATADSPVADGTPGSID
ncbi:hypothetical protein EA462_14075 [Natrarchaeobius halalkaliphilus]|uniref:Uncharacterized protein n=1 Tax=Natrarchaeobius halalkaliphilus TaxID=1679091 RepID=A0A3N6LJA8_9EURY|nr:hypothetical protein [Natrarchaeobius halalkaliphilus]RQG87981.1 hypothetical protein EA462_14075 [Natrarchaeobius halalkaliphilus]